MDIATEVTTLLKRHPSVDEVKLVGSRKRADETALSDWDFEVEVNDLERFVEALPNLVGELHPLGRQWDPLSDIWCYQLMLRGPTKVDILVDRPHEREAPWEPGAENLQELDHHFWDWTLWLAGKALRGRGDFVEAELRKMSEHLLRPLGVEGAPDGLERAVHVYRAARSEVEARLGYAVDTRIENEVLEGLRRAGLKV